MSLILDKCIEFDRVQKICVAKEKGKTYRLENNSSKVVKKVKIDKCIAQKENEGRCDYLMQINDQEIRKVYFIELKGGDLSHAVEQIYDTIKYLKEEFKGYCLNARIVGSSDVPNLTSQPKYVKLAKEIVPTRGTIERATNKIYTEKI